MQVQIDWNNFSKYRIVTKVLEYKGGRIYKTKFIKYVKKSYIPYKDEIVTALSTSLVGHIITIKD